MNLFEKLNRLDDSLVESKRVVKKKKLTESTEQYELSTLVNDSINHLVNDLGKDPMSDDFGDDVCADLENNYEIDVPQEPVRYANWCYAVMSEVSRQLNNKDEMLIETVSSDDTLKRIIANDNLVRIDAEKLIDYRIRSAAKTGKCPICGGDLANMVCDNCKNSYRQDGNNGTNYTLIDAALLKSIQKVDPSFNGLSLDEKAEYLYNCFFLGGSETATRNISGNQIEKDAQRKNKINKLLGNTSYNTSGDRVRKDKQHIKQQLLQAAKFENENTKALEKVKPEDYIKNNIVRKN